MVGEGGELVGLKRCAREDVCDHEEDLVEALQCQLAQSRRQP